MPSLPLLPEARTPRSSLDSAQIDHHLRLLDSILQPVEAVEPSGHHPGVGSVLFEKLLRVRDGSRLKQFESGHYVSYHCHNSPSNPIKYRPLNVGHQRMLHRPARFERGQNRVGVDRSALKNLVAQRVREGIQDRSAPASNRRLADTASADRRLRIRNIQRRPLHVHGNIQNRRRLVLVEPLGNHLAIVRIEHPFLADRMADAERRTAEHLSAERARMDHCADIGVGEEIDDVVLAGFDIHLDFGEAGDIGMRRCRRAGSCPCAAATRP